MQGDIFISYSRKDLDAVKPIKEELEAKGFPCWMDLERIESGYENFAQKIVPALDDCMAVLFFISADSQKSEWTAKELGYAKRHGKRVVPLRFNDDALVGEFDFNYGGSDIIDWRVLVQKEKMLRDLRTWLGHVGRGKDNVISEDQALPPVCRSGLELAIHPARETSLRLKTLVPSENERLSGFCVVDLDGDIVLISERLNSVIRSARNDLRLSILPESGNPFHEALQSVDPVVARVLAWKKSNRGNCFRNEAKIGLATDVLLGLGDNLPEVISVFRTDYYSSFCTNEMATLDVFEEDDYGNGRIWAGTEHYPCRIVEDKTIEMLPFSRPGFSNHLGGNTLGITDDGMLVLWLQSRRAERSQNLWAPTGSGSLDWADLDPAGWFFRTIENGATRELREECRLGDNGSIKIRTKVIGYYRWCGRGGLPGFCCVSRIGCDASCLSPAPEEVCVAKGRPLLGMRTARNREDLLRTVETLLSDDFDPDHGLSTPLRVNLLILRRALEDNAPELSFLFDRN